MVELYGNNPICYGSQEVIGSIPICSTPRFPATCVVFFCPVAPVSDHLEVVECHDAAAGQDPHGEIIVHVIGEKLCQGGRQGADPEVGEGYWEDHR